MVGKIDNQTVTNYQALNGNSLQTVSSQEESLFLEQKLQEVKDKQGFIGNAWNGIKEIINLGVSEEKCEKMLDKYNSGEISFDEAVEYLEKYDKKQKASTDLITNIAVGTASIALATTAVAGGPIGWGLAIAKGAPIGSALKTGISFLDRASNKVEGDALDGKTIIKDVISGATTGATSAVSSGIGGAIKSAEFGKALAKGAQCGALCGGSSGAIGYLADVILEEDKEFDTVEFLGNTATSAFYSSLVGTGVGAGLYGIACANGTVGQEVSRSVAQTVVKDSVSSATRKFGKTVLTS